MAGFCLIGAEVSMVFVEHQGVEFIALQIINSLDELPRSMVSLICCHNGLGVMGPPAVHRSAPRKQSALFCSKQFVYGIVGRKIVCDLLQRFRVAMEPQIGGAKLRFRLFSWQRPLAATAARGRSQSATLASSKR